MFGSGELWFSASSYSSVPGRNIIKGIYPKTTKTMVMKSGAAAFSHAIGMPYNAKSKAGAMVLINFLISAEAQYQKALPDVYGIGTILDLNRLPPEWQQKFKNIPRHKATLDPITLAKYEVKPDHDYILPLE